MKNKQEIQALSIKELVLYVQNCSNSDDRISFRTNRGFHELVKRCIQERGLSGESEFFTKLANDYFGKIGWMERKIRSPQYVTFEDLEFESEHECNVAERRVNCFKNNP